MTNLVRLDVGPAHVLERDIRALEIHPTSTARESTTMLRYGTNSLVQLFLVVEHL